MSVCQECIRINCICDLNQTIFIVKGKEMLLDSSKSIQRFGLVSDCTVITDSIRCKKPCVDDTFVCKVHYKVDGKYTDNLKKK
jgi:hypothetical protein